jgi:hypothetical protein
MESSLSDSVFQLFGYFFWSLGFPSMDLTRMKMAMKTLADNKSLELSLEPET